MNKALWSGLCSSSVLALGLLTARTAQAEVPIPASTPHLEASSTIPSPASAIPIYVPAPETRSLTDLPTLSSTRTEILVLDPNSPMVRNAAANPNCGCSADTPADIATDITTDLAADLELSTFDPNSDAVGDAAIATRGCDCMGCRNLTLQMLKSSALKLGK